MWFTQCGLRPREKFPGPFFLLSNKMKGYNLQHTRYNFLFFLSWSPYSEYNIHNDTYLQYISLTNKGFLLGKKTLT